MNSVDWREYTASLNSEASEAMQAFTQEARENRIPIMQPEAMALVNQLIRLKEPGHILEIGTAVGWSAINMAKAGRKHMKITTVERDPKMAEAAKANIRQFQFEENIEVLEGDVLDIGSQLDECAPFDMILIDAGKGHYQEYFNRFIPLLAPQGIVICDNVYFRGYVIEPDKAPKRYQRLAQKMNDFNQWLSRHRDFKTVFIPIGDGLSLSMRLDRLKREEKGF